MTHPICGVISGPTFDLAHQQILAVKGYATVLEFRLDLLSHIETQKISQLRALLSLPVIFTLRAHQFKNGFTDNHKQLLNLKPEYVDLESQLSKKLFIEAATFIPEATLICSFHDFENTPDDLDALADILKKHSAHIFKVAAMANSSLDTMRILRFVKNRTLKGEQWIGVSMGEFGHFGRILGPIFGNAMTYGAPDEHSLTAPGQLTVHELVDRYRCDRMNRNTIRLGLIGDPVSKSPSHVTHNALLRQNQIDAVYVKAKVAPHQCGDFIKAAQQLGFHGLSVTMPLKEEIMKYVEVSDEAKKIGAVNTLFFQENAVHGYNTDGMGALRAIQQQMQVCGKHAVILGAGGAAMAIAYCLKQAGGHVTLLNRRLDKAEELAKRIGVNAFSIDEFPRIARDGYDLLINCTSVGMSDENCPVDPNYLLPQRYVMEVISVPKETPLVRAALEKQCGIIYGFDMFLQQAQGQFEVWFGLNK